MASAPSYDEFLQTRFYREWARPQRLVDFVSAVLDKSTTGAALFGVFRHQRDGVVDEAIVEAALRPTMRFVEPKSADQQARAVAFRTREQLVKQRTEAVNALRSHLYEFGHVAPEGIG